MKPGFSLACFISICVLANLSCQKEYSCENCREENSIPVANAGVDQALILPKDSAQLNGSASTDTDGSIQKWEWKKIAGPNSFQITGITSAIATVRNLQEGIYQFELTVIDDKGSSARDTVVITVTNAGITNRPPLARAGADQIISLPTSTVLLDGSASHDPDNNIASYSWTKLDGPSCNIVTSTTVQTKVDNLVEGSYLFALKVTDAGGLYSIDTIQIGIKEEPSTICFNDRPKIHAQLVSIGFLSGNRSQLTLASAADKIVFAGGWEQNNGRVALARTEDLYEWSSQSWSLSIQTPHLGAAVATNGNKIYFGGGGYYYSDYYSDIDVYDAVNNIWERISFKDAKTLAAGAAIGNKVMFAGGFKKSGDDFPNNVENLVEIYEPSTRSWSSVTLSEARGGITSVIIRGKVYFAGGWNTTSSNKIDIYDDATNSWSVSTLTYLKTAKTAIAHGDKIYWTDASCKVEIRNVETGAGSLENLSRSGETISVIKDNKVVFIRPGSRYFDVYDPSLNSWSTGVLQQELPLATAVISVNNIIYVAGGIIGHIPLANGSYGPVLTNQVWKLEF